MSLEIPAYDNKGNEKGKRQVSEKIFGVEPNVPLLTQYIHVYRTNQRQGTSKVKTRSEVRGGGKKPWRQKGTGRARHGSIRSPIWRGGGVAHGPSPKSWKLSFPKKMREAALKSVLSLKQSESKIRVVDKASIRKPSSVKILDLLEKINLHGKVLYVQKENSLVVRKSLANIKNVRTALVENLCPYEILLAKELIFTEDALDYLEKKYENK